MGLFINPRFGGRERNTKKTLPQLTLEITHACNHVLQYKINPKLNQRSNYARGLWIEEKKSAMKVIFENDSTGSGCYDGRLL